MVLSLFNNQEYWSLSERITCLLFHLILFYDRMLYSFISYSLVVIEQTENGLVEAVAVLISKMPRMRPELEAGKLGECFKAKPDFMKVFLFLMVYILFKLL